MARSLLVLAVLAPLAAVFAACLTTPAARSPLREELDAADSSTIEQAARGCLEHAGWKADPIGGMASGANVVTGYKGKARAEVFIYPPKSSPRVTGGPDYSDIFWKCLASELRGQKSAPAEAESGDAGS